MLHSCLLLSPNRRPAFLGQQAERSGTVGRAGRRLGGVGLALALLLANLSSLAWAGDRTAAVIPRAADATPIDLSDHRFTGESAALSFGAEATAEWERYQQLWHAHAADPSDPAIRRFLGLPLQQEYRFQAQRGRSSLRAIGWKGGTYAEVETAHFQIASRAGEAATRHVARDLERCFWIWTQLFYPLWESSAQVDAALQSLPADQPIGVFLEQQASRLNARNKMRVVLFRDSDEYQQALGPRYPGIEHSTGFYADDQRTTFLYAGDHDDAATRRHELTHQLFREATRSSLRRRMPAEQQGFWLIEGIAGYMESLHLPKDDAGDAPAKHLDSDSVNGVFATVGGWDASRLQFARYRVLVLGDSMSLDDLRRDGRLDAQQRTDLARWYAHAIAQTHRLMDGGEPQHRRWVFKQLQRAYAIGGDELPEVSDEVVLQDSELALRRFLQVDDAHLASNPVDHPLSQLVLAECPVSAEAIRALPKSANMQWLDLTRIAVGNDDVQRLVPRPDSMQQLRLEATRIDDDLADWLGDTRRLSELDLSWTKIGDTSLSAIEHSNQLEVLYLTGTQITDASIPWIAALPALETVDLQRSGVTDAGLQQLRSARPDLQINPLQLR